MWEEVCWGSPYLPQHFALHLPLTPIALPYTHLHTSHIFPSTPTHFPTHPIAWRKFREMNYDVCNSVTKVPRDHWIRPKNITSMRKQTTGIHRTTRRCIAWRKVQVTKVLATENTTISSHTVYIISPHPADLMSLPISSPQLPVRRLITAAVFLCIKNKPASPFSAKGLSESHWHRPMRIVTRHANWLTATFSHQRLIAFLHNLLYCSMQRFQAKPNKTFKR